MTREDLLSKRMKDLADEAAEDFQLTDFNLKEKTLLSPNTKIKWVRILAEEQRFLSALEERMKEYKQKILDTKFNIKTVNDYKVNLDLEKDGGVKKINEAITEQKDVIRLVEGIVKIAQGFGYDIRNCVDIVKLESQ